MFGLVGGFGGFLHRLRRTGEYPGDDGRGDGPLELCHDALPHRPEEEELLRTESRPLIGTFSTLTDAQIQPSGAVVS